MVAAKAGTPSAARNFLNTLHRLMAFAVECGVRPDDPTLGVKRPKIKTAGWRTWTEEDIAAFEAKHPIGTQARLAMALMLFTGQRRGDIVTWAANMCATTDRSAPAQDGDAAHHSDPPRSPGNPRRHALRAPVVSNNGPRQAVYKRCRLRELVRQVLPGGRLAERHGGSRVPQGSLPASCRSRMQCVGDHGDQRSQEPFRSAALLRSCRSSRPVARGAGQSAQRAQRL